MKRYQIFLSALLPLLDFVLVVGAFIIAGSLRANHDLIPGLRLPVQTISSQDLLFFALLGAVLLVIIESIRTGYVSRVYFSFKRIGLDILSTAALWFVTIIAIIYLGNGYLYSVEIPRLVLLFAIILYVPFGIAVRLFLVYAVRACMSLQYIERASAHSLTTLSPAYQQYYEQSLGYRVVLLSFSKLKEAMRDRLPDILIIPAQTSPAEVLELQKIARIYGIRVELLQIDGSTAQYAHIDTDGDFPILSIEYIRISTWGRLLKRVFDIIFGVTFLILFAPLMLIIALAIKWDDPTAPVIYHNKRTGKNGQLFTLYKFRYMQWQYSVKDAYGVDPAIDTALKFEQELRAGDKNSRTGPIYKITQGDPRHTRIGSLIERLSLDELPQLFNVLIGNMSLVGPRPHQPREVENYDEWHKQVLTVKPGITGMAQVFAREAADFDREAELDISYIENWSMPLDIWLLLSTLRVLIIKRHG